MRRSPCSQVNPKKLAWRARQARREQLESERETLERRIVSLRERQHAARPGSPAKARLTDRLLNAVEKRNKLHEQLTTRELRELRQEDRLRLKTTRQVLNYIR